METERIKNTSNLGIQFWVGLFVILGILASSYLAINIAGMSFSNSGTYRISAEFNDISGLKDGAPVEIAGVRIGEVAGIRLNSTRAIADLLIKNEFQLRSEDIAQIRTKGIIGDKYVRISPGGSDIVLEPGEMITDTESSVDFEDIIGKFIYSLNKDSDEPAK